MTMTSTRVFLTWRREPKHLSHLPCTYSTPRGMNFSHSLDLTEGETWRWAEYKSQRLHVLFVFSDGAHSSKSRRCINDLLLKSRGAAQNVSLLSKPLWLFRAAAPGSTAADGAPASGPFVCRWFPVLYLFSNCVFLWWMLVLLQIHWLKGAFWVLLSAAALF